MALMIDIGLRRLPQPPIPIVIPDSSSATTSSSVQRLSVIGPLSSTRIRVSLVDEGVAMLVGHTRQVQFEREALLEAIAAFHIPQVDAVERFLRSADHRRRLLGN